ncbi:MarR family winged helix-turn-helix transcriptional regulator [Paracoccus sp. MBLB3053]|uniref:MarR family winged helix-turn-helix transcriptional regulator n=1 Tax=Paracoccus aurantius TaxID=3073814 RepID=A0ABU2HW39_9RHOB|nr:MarR family winged helix-turn-helix transcriptional regulator [Paracoccus sp. MBLB3053]MDS9469251.1 MarR family winged helix-turn-helix transcriptional regulator [Paracoccus sp. MBLB3053]
MTGFVLNDFLPYRLAVAASRVSRAFERRYMAEAGITVPEWRVLAHLSQEGAVSVREIELRADMEKSKVSRAASRLQRQGLIEKLENPGDRRLVSLSLTPKGLIMVERLIPLAMEFQSELQAVLGDRLLCFDKGLATICNGKF